MNNLINGAGAKQFTKLRCADTESEQCPIPRANPMSCLLQANVMHKPGVIGALSPFANGIGLLLGSNLWHAHSVHIAAFSLHHLANCSLASLSTLWPARNWHSLHISSVSLLTDSPKRAAWRVARVAQWTGTICLLLPSKRQAHFLRNVWYIECNKKTPQHSLIHLFVM